MGFAKMAALGLVAAVGMAGSAFGATQVVDPSGKTVMVVDGDHVTVEGKEVMTIDGDNIKDASGKQVLYINGDNIRDKPEGTILLIIDGRHIKREVGGTNLLYVDGKDLMRGDRSGKPLYHFGGDDLDSQQRMAILYALMPEMFTGGKGGDAAIVAAQGKAGAGDEAAAVANFAEGNYKIDNYLSTDATKHAGTVQIVKAGDVFAIQFNYTGEDAVSGVAVQHGDELWAAVGPAGTVGMAVYGIDGGNLKGIWYNATGKAESFGMENATGAADLGGDYKITEAKAPFTGTAYVGTLSLEKQEAKGNEKAQLFLAAWDLGGYKAKGIGFTDGKSLVVASSTGADFQVIRFKINAKGGRLEGEFATVNKVRGAWVLEKQQ